MFAKVPLSLMICSLLAVPAVAQDAPDVSVAVVPTRAKGGPNLRGQVRNRIEKKLKGRLEVVPFGVFRRAARRAGLKGRAALDRANAIEAGSAAGVTHICYIEGQREREGRKKFYFAEVTLVEVSSGGVVFTNRYELKGRKLNAVIAGGILEELVAALTTPPPPPEPVEEPPPPPEAPPPVEPPAEPLAVSSATEPPVEEPPPPEPAEEPPTVSALTPSFGEPTISVSEPVSRRKAKRWRPALHVGLGGAVLYRDAKQTAAGGDGPNYDGPLPGGYLRLDFYPMAIGGRGNWYEGFGLHAEAQYMRVETRLDQNDPDRIATSDVIAGNGGLSFRFVFWDSPTAVDFTFKGGYGVFIFPLPGTFPGTRYLSPYAGGHFTIPFIEEVALVAGGQVSFLVDVDGRLKRLGTFDSGLGFRADAGVRLYFDPFEIMLIGRFEQWQTDYTGTSELTGWDNTSMADQMYGGYVTAGVAF